MGLRNAARKAHALQVAARRAVGSAEFRLAGSGAAPAIAQPAGGAPLPLGSSLLLSSGATARDAWIQWLQPVFAGRDSCYFTGTYSDEYGYCNGLMLQRNVHKDFVRFLDSFGFDRRWVVGIEQHQYRDILHLHAILEGSFSQEQLTWTKAWWESERGFARALPVLDGCESYVTKYALKGDTDAFEWSL